MPNVGIKNTVPNVGVTSRRTYSAGLGLLYNDAGTMYDGASYYDGDVVWTDVFTPHVGIRNT